MLSEFFPQDLRDQFAVEVWLPESATIGQTDRAAAQVEKILQALSPYTDAEGNAQERLRAMVTVVGKGCDRWYLGRSPESAKSNYAEIVVRTTDGRLTPDFVSDVRRIARDGDAKLGIEPVLGARVIPRELTMGPPLDSPIGIRIFGPRLGVGFADLDVMNAQADRLEDILRNQPGTWDIYASWGSPGYELEVDVDEDKANLAGVTNASIAQTLNGYFSGHLLTTYTEGDHTVPVGSRSGQCHRGLDQNRTALLVGEPCPHQGFPVLPAQAHLDQGHWIT
ncbi:MAG: efflux RND transporter permease subunit, partial [Bacteroidetes bacterium]|nr:efflux RND transporter permease subunit [Bacteroidota bacterium]